jgi:glyoxylase-like metal-dependent hydrolase (beta-lactamase superfamily II)
MNCYIYYDEKSKDAVIIDPGAFADDEKESIRKFVETNGLNISRIINTHGHIDHVLGNSFAKEAFDKPICMNEDDLFLLEGSRDQARFFGLEIPQLPGIDEFLNEGDIIPVGNAELKVIKTPGHSPGSVCLIDDKNKTVFCGDLIFHNSVGRTDLPGGNYKVLINSISDKLFGNTGDDYVIYPGHMEETTVGNEKKYNPFLIS